MKVSEMSGALLDYWVACANESWKWAHEIFHAWTLDATFKEVELITYEDGTQQCILLPNNPFRQDPQVFAPSANWTHAGPLIERERIGVMPVGIEWKAWAISDMDATAVGIEPLVAAMRAFVSSKYGEDVPDPEKHAA